MPDGTTIAGGDVISTEELTIAADGVPARPRGASDLPATAYKLPRSKLAVGAFDADGGDVTASNPLPVESRSARQIAELAASQGAELGAASMMTRSRERYPLVDRRGRLTTDRGAR